MTLPTASTPGYTYYTDAFGRKWVCCECVAAWLPWYQKMLLHAGIIQFCINVWQLTGGATDSKGTHSQGGAIDTFQYSNNAIAIAREMGATGSWHRTVAQGFSRDHAHMVLRGCPHSLDTCAYQVKAQAAGFNGLGYLGRGGPDYHPDPQVYRTWSQGIDYAKQVLGTPTTVKEWWEMAIPDSEISRIAAAVVSKLMATPIDNPVPGGPDQSLAISEWSQNYHAHEAWVEAKAANAKIDALTNLVTKFIQGQGTPNPPEPVPALGVDVSGNQTVDQVRAVVADAANKFVFVKATEGYTFNNLKYADQIKLVRDDGDTVPGVYHFAWLSQDPIQEADHFLGYAGLQTGEVIGLDVEDWGETDPSKPKYAEHKAMRDNTPWSQRVDYAIRWCEYVEQKTGAQPVIYVNWNYIRGLRTAATPEQWSRLTTFLQWQAVWTKKLPDGTSRPRLPGEYDHVDGQNGEPDGWKVLFHQYSGSPLDRDWVADLNALPTIGVR